jgi:hypothetical protein
MNAYGAERDSDGVLLGVAEIHGDRLHLLSTVPSAALVSDFDADRSHYCPDGESATPNLIANPHPI